ncbi:unnamed protein product [Paramecium sonneborni]|uniref:Uncharacterized protein n=1 Tax=Paramecium sonneborni TaxID=65129 RepID=A0A8S1Q3X9_9CILI|nr:unnamed protein product [Paramecium sonneborni]
MKPSLNFDFNEVQFDEQQIPNYTREFMDQMRDHMYHVRKFEQIQKNQTPKLISQRPMSAQAKYLMTPQEKHKYLKKKEPIQVSPNKQSQLKNTSNVIKFGKTYISETIPVIHSNIFISGSDVQLSKQTNSSKVSKMKSPIQQIINKPQQINQKSLDQPVKNEVIGVFDWEEEFDEQFFIKEAMKYQEKNQRLQTIEKVNREQFLQKVKTQQSASSLKNVKQTKEDILKQQQMEIQQKQAKLEQLRQYNNSLQPIETAQKFKEEEDNYENDFVDEEQIIEQKIVKQQQIVQNNEEDDDYGKDGFEVYEENKVMETNNIDDEKQWKQNENLKKKEQIQNKTTTDSKSTLTYNSKTRKKQIIYRAKNAKERKEELEGMREELQKNLIENDAESAKIYKLLQDSREKEKIMIEVNSKRREELILARLTLQQLSEKIDQQLHMIDDLDKKEHYAQQIIEKLKENRKRQQQQYDEEIEKFLACKVIARFLKCKKDRKLFLELRRQKFMNMLIQ